ncbi:hypothetical protein [Miltoncostaea marina]|uniref:hypothetical protein n=1 Tax=Miltoncostaea marina TaxID=2843215 RepID=UPI001C3CFB0C|nr:hypothetical protein [Miltoncostaea marina]
MAGNSNSGRRPDLETVMRDAGMAGRLFVEQLQGAASTYQDHGAQLARVYREAQENQRRIDEAIAALQRERVGWDGVTERRRRPEASGLAAAA